MTGTEASAEGHAYVGRRPCGCVRAAVWDAPGDSKTTANWVADFVRDGLTVERVTVPEARRLLLHGAGCQHQGAKPARRGRLGEQTMLMGGV